MLGVAGWYSTNILGNRDGEVLDDPESFKTKEESKLGVLEYILQPQVYPELYGNIFHKVRINYYPPRGDNKEGWDNIDIFGWLGYPMQIKVDFLCRDSILAAPLVLDLALFSDLAQRAGMSGIQEWLSFYFKSPQVAPGPVPGARPLHPADQAQEHAALDDGRGADHAPRGGVLRGGMRSCSRDAHEILPSHAPGAGHRAGAVRAVLRRPARSHGGDAEPPEVRRRHRPRDHHGRRPRAGTTRWSRWRPTSRARVKWIGWPSAFLLWCTRRPIPAMSFAAPTSPTTQEISQMTRMDAVRRRLIPLLVLFAGSFLPAFVPLLGGAGAPSRRRGEPPPSRT